jgi:hypothetical protein
MVRLRQITTAELPHITTAGPAEPPHITTANPAGFPHIAMACAARLAGVLTVIVVAASDTNIEVHSHPSQPGLFRQSS